MIPVVIFDGMSGAGKTTLRYKLYQYLDGNVLTIDRFTPSVWVYDYLREKNRRIEIQKIEEEFQAALFPLCVLLFCDFEESLKRISKNVFRISKFTPEKEARGFEIYRKDISKYTNILCLDSSRKDSEILLKEILGRMKS